MDVERGFVSSRWVESLRTKKVLHETYGTRLRKSIHPSIHPSTQSVLQRRATTDCYHSPPFRAHSPIHRCSHPYSTRPLARVAASPTYLAILFCYPFGTAAISLLARWYSEVRHLVFILFRRLGIVNMFRSTWIPETTTRLLGLGQSVSL